MTVKRMDNVGIVVADIDAAIEFFTELGLELEGRAPIEGEWADGVTGLRGMRVEIAMMRTPDGHSRLELSRFLAPPVVADHRSAPVNALGYLRVMFTVDDIDDTLARLSKCGAALVGEVVQYEHTYRLCYIRGPEEILIGLAQELGPHTSKQAQMTTATRTLIDLETKFWQSMVDQDTDAALQLLHEPSQMASSHGAMKFDHAGYRKMAEQGSTVVTAFALSDIEVLFASETTAVMTYRVKQTVAAREGGKSGVGTVQDMSDTSTWVYIDKRWQCVLHTESQMDAKAAKH